MYIYIFVLGLLSLHFKRFTFETGVETQCLSDAGLKKKVFTELALRPLWSSSRNVRPRLGVSLYVSVPFPCNFFRGLSLALRSHDQFEASDWSTLLH